MSRSWRVPREGPKQNVRPSGPHKQKNRTDDHWYDDLFDDEDIWLDYWRDKDKEQNTHDRASTPRQEGD